MTKTDITPEIALTGIGGAAAALFALLASRGHEPRTFLGDLRMRRRIPFYHGRAKDAAFHFGRLGKEAAVGPAAALLTGSLLSSGKTRAAAAVSTATAAAIAASHIFDATLPQKTPPPGRRAPLDPHFPSGHALNSSSLLAIAAWVLSREGIADRRSLGIAASVLGFSLGVDRLMHDRHWTSDVVGGWLAAIAIAAFTAAGYEYSKRGEATRRPAANRPARRKNR